jgi:4-hydroxyproline epimerase
MTTDVNLEISIIDSHTGGEPTRVIVGGGPDLGSGPLAERVEIFRNKYDVFRSAVIQEPRGSDVLVGAILVEPTDPTCAAGVIFFNNVGYLGMCGHGTIGLVETLAFLGKISVGKHRIETPVGIVTAELHESGKVSVTNVLSYREHAKVTVKVPGIGDVVGDVVWGGNWFFLTAVGSVELSLANIDELRDVASKIRDAVNEQGYPEIDHIELFGKPVSAEANSKNFVLCPGKEYDRSPCGTGTSAKVTCLAADGKLEEGQIWVQESIIGSCFEASFEASGDQIIPTITGRAFITAESTLILRKDDPYRWGIKN